jgi:hypothetical protein
LEAPANAAVPGAGRIPAAGQPPTDAPQAEGENGGEEMAPAIGTALGKAPDFAAAPTIKSGKEVVQIEALIYVSARRVIYVTKIATKSRVLSTAKARTTVFESRKNT